MQKIDLDSDLARERLSAWLTGRLDARPVTVTAFTKPKSGFSAETSIVDVEAGGQPLKLVLRREVPDPAVYPQQAPGLDVEIDIQYRIMSSLHEHASVPLAPLIGYEADDAVLGAPFFVMGFRGGDVPTESPPYPDGGFFAEATPQQRRRMMEQGIAQMAAIHAVDWRAAGLEWLAPADAAPGTAQQLALWRRYAEVELRGREHPLMAEAFEWLETRVPTDESIGLCWGDPRPGNIIWNDFDPLCLTDFEAASIASPEQDLGWWLMFGRTMYGDRPYLEGDPTRAEQIAIYEAARGRPVAHADFHEVFAGARYTAIVVRVMNRLVDRGDLDPNHRIWIENPATLALDQIIKELVRP